MLRSLALYTSLVFAANLAGPAGAGAVDWQAARDPLSGSMATVTLINDIASY